MEWWFSVIVVPFVVYLFKSWLNSRKDMVNRIEALESKVITAEIRISEIRDDVEEIKEIRDVLTDVKLDIREIKTFLNKKGA
ncbi:MULTISPECIES: DUF2746 domain-containing protein [Klebsiella/Raoultella group]|uniref:DUF2746 domain-containing protein n=1 Tax=Klebsiella michiganensis TaxID=1134687 RepID=A0AAJ1NY31_9ENTR|nr:MULTISPECIES: DUF2746 domain-containing protein [Klebsiella/Raoultella group]HED2544666.1 DUF2746 domain-containing protein [Raoultella planticola]ELK6035851.1 DUF2746 domain-containing protein [Raoultella ornithinolytica]ELM7288290.1 DUF2746 domain-containing protein [Raoultella ornithinolytica]ELO0973790.1 DUF2746 domain-containing protein [Raoultella ornithinolytica]MCC2038546.1 DUF2746 domain-containing protein [Raoultella ornithinolytica]